MGSRNNKSFTLRDIRRLVSKAEKQGEGIHFLSRAIYAHYKGDKDILLPHLYSSTDEYKVWRAKNRGDNKRVRQYKAKLDNMIREHGADKVLYLDTNDEGEVQSANWSFEDQKGESVCETTKGGRKGPSAAQGSSAPTNTSLTSLLKAMGKSVTKARKEAGGNGSQDPLADQLVNGAPSTSAARKSSGRGQAAGGDKQSRSFREQALSAEAKLTGNARLLESPQLKTAKTGSKGDKQGVGTSAATSFRGTGRPLPSLGSGLKTKMPNGCSTGDVASPGNHLPPSPTTYTNGSPLGDMADGDWHWGGGYSSFGAVNAYRGRSYYNPHGKSLSMGSFGSLASGFGKSSKAISSSAEWTAETGSVSVEDAWRKDNPGGMVNAVEAGSMSKRLKKQAASIQASMEACLVAMDIGAGLDPSPRRSGKKLVKELVGSSYRMARCQKEELQTGLKLILVDISPSCSEIRDACYAAALAIADLDKDAVVVCHFNGYSESRHSAAIGGQKAGTMLVGKRQREVPHFDPCNEKELEAWASKADVSGVIAFGDGDAASLYALLAKYMPMVWLFPEEEEYAKQLLSRWQPKEVLDRNGKLWIVSNVTDAKTCVQGLRKVTKGK